MTLPYQHFDSDDAHLVPQRQRSIGRRKRSYRNYRQSDILETWEYALEAKERGKNHHDHFCEAVKHADALNERFAFVPFPFTPYWSSLQQCYHVGRDKRMRPVAAIEFLRYSRARARLNESDPQ